MVAASRVDLSGWRWGPRLIGAFAPRCPEVSSWGSDASIPRSGRRATTTCGWMREQRSGRVHGSPAAPLPAGQVVKLRAKLAAGEGALGGADNEQQQVFNDVASICFECL
jgi:hypothetical protein